MSTSALFQPIRVGAWTLQHRIVLPGLTRLRSEPDGSPLLPLVPEYYSQRGSTPGTLLISEGTFVVPAMDAFPGLYTEEHARKWKNVTDAVHAKGSYILLQIASAGRVANPAVLAKLNPPVPFTAPSAIAQPPGPFVFSDEVPREMTKDEIKEEIELYAKTARLAIEVGGFDGIELHACNGSLIEQFLKDVSNVREDEYGGSPERRARFGLEVVEALVKVVGEERLGVRVSPWNADAGLAMKNPEPTYAYFASELRTRFPSLAYLHAIEARVDRGGNDRDDPDATQSIEFLRKIWAGPGRVFISAGGYNRTTAIERAERSAKEYDGLIDMVAFGRFFIANPDLPLRLKNDLPLNPYDRSTFYIPGDASGKGYTDYPFYSSDGATTQ
ncbi:hypothetical protein HGRIS_007186 [Hohenbuehelia grisea]|uniref:NADH:flavin oxidoreductase/NADH oxidase N-terminal domain-containing protein n=1 Tax=Hohenbuehelia grisea TaxID=104357 RepID=A0ABR3JCZ5_9AGAR